MNTEKKPKKTFKSSLFTKIENYSACSPDVLY